MIVDKITRELLRKIQDELFATDAKAEVIAEICRALIDSLEILAEAYDADDRAEKEGG